MCMSTPDIPPPPPPPQEVKQASSMVERRRSRPQGGMGGGTMLTGPSGISSGALNTGGNTLLGG